MIIFKNGINRVAWFMNAIWIYVTALDWCHLSMQYPPRHSQH
jgi:hypothetical protein